MSYFDEKPGSIQSDTSIARLIASPMGMISVAVLFFGAYLAIQAGHDVSDTFENRGRYTAEIGGEGEKTVIYERSQNGAGDPEPEKPPCSECGGAKIVAKWNEDKTIAMGTQTCPTCKGTGFAI